MLFKFSFFFAEVLFSLSNRYARVHDNNCDTTTIETQNPRVYSKADSPYSKRHTELYYFTVSVVFSFCIDNGTTNSYTNTLI